MELDLVWHQNTDMTQLENKVNKNNEIRPGMKGVPVCVPQYMKFKRLRLHTTIPGLAGEMKHPEMHHRKNGAPFV